MLFGLLIAGGAAGPAVEPKSNSQMRKSAERIGNYPLNNGWRNSLHKSNLSESLCLLHTLFPVASRLICTLYKYKNVCSTKPLGLVSVCDLKYFALKKWELVRKQACPRPHIVPLTIYEGLLTLTAWSQAISLLQTELIIEVLLFTLHMYIFTLYVLCLLYYEEKL